MNRLWILLAFFTLPARADVFSDDNIEADLRPCVELDLHHSRIEVMQKIFQDPKQGVKAWREQWRQAVATREKFTQVCAQRVANPTQADASLLKEVQTTGSAAVTEGKKFAETNKALQANLWTAVNPMRALGGSARKCGDALNKVRDYMKTKAERERADLDKMKTECQFKSGWFR